MINDVPRAPSDPELRAQVLELYRVIAMMRDQIDYQFGVVEDRFGETKNAAETTDRKTEKALEEIRREIKELERPREGVTYAVSTFDLGAYGLTFEAGAEGFASSAVRDAVSMFDLGAYGLTFETSAVGEITQ